jgi:transcriptional regulator with PAS, ATPase and Fis domain
VIEETDLPYDFALAPAKVEQDIEGQSLDAAMLAFEKSFLRKALKRHHWNRKAAAEELKIGYSTLKAKLKSYGLANDEDEE